MSQENVEIARKLIELYNERDVEGVLRYINPDIECFPAQDEPESAPYKGIDEFAARMRETLDSFDEYLIDVDEYIEQARVKVQEVMVKDRATADRVARQAKSGGNFNQLVQNYTERLGYKKRIFIQVIR